MNLFGFRANRLILPLFLLCVSNLHAQDAMPPSDPVGEVTAVPEASPVADAKASDATVATGIDPTKFADPVAKVNGKSITRRDFELMANGILASQGVTITKIPPDQRQDFYRGILQQMITERLISEKAINQEVNEAEIDEEIAKLKSRYTDPAKYEKELAEAGKTDEILRIDLTNRKRQQKYLEAQLKDKVKVTDAEIKKFYGENPDFFKAPDTLRANQIVVVVAETATLEERSEKMKKAQRISEDVHADPTKFEELVKTESDDPKAKENGGDTGLFARERFPFPEFYDAVSKLEVGQISEPIRTPIGFHVVKLTEKKSARTIPLTEAKERVTEFMSSQKRQEAFEKHVATLKKGAKVEVLEPSLLK